MRGLKLFALCLALVSHAPAQPEIQARIASLRQSLKDRPIAAPEFPNLNASIDTLLKAAAAALVAGRPYLGLETLAQATDLYEGARTFEATSATVKTLPDFETEWRKT